MFMYRGQEGMWSWLLHRVTGLGIVLFLGLHILDTALVGFGPNAYNTVTALYHNPVVRVMEVVLAGMVLYHALNGIRVVLIDFWTGAPRIQRQLWYAVLVLFVVLFVPAAYFMLRPFFVA